MKVLHFFHYQRVIYYIRGDNSAVVVNQVPLFELLNAFARDAGLKIYYSPTFNNATVSCNYVEEEFQLIMDKLGMMGKFNWTLKDNLLLIEGINNN